MSTAGAWEHWACLDPPQTAEQLPLGPVELVATNDSLCSGIPPQSTPRCACCVRCADCANLAAALTVTSINSQIRSVAVRGRGHGMRSVHSMPAVTARKSI